MTQKENAMHVLVTGAAGFIGFHLSRRLTADGHTVVGIDNLNDYYDVRLKEDRLAQLAECRNFRFEKLDLADSAGMAELFRQERFTHVVNLAAQAGVRYSLINPASYISSNLVGFGNILEGCRQTEVQHLVFASSSSVYGLNTHQPFSEHDNVDHPVSLYAASKKSNELMAHSYSHLFNIPCTGLRFFTVYGPWGRPDMALQLFAHAIMRGEPIKVFNEGRMRRDFTYIDDIVEGVVRLLPLPPARTPDWNAEQPPLAHFQYRQQSDRRTQRLYRHSGRRAGQEGQTRPAAHAAGRCGSYVGQHRRPVVADRLCSGNASGRRYCPLR